MSARTIFCRSCGAAEAHRFGKDRQRRQRYKCAACSRVFTNRTNTSRAGSHLSDRDWQMAERIFVSRGGMSGADLSRILGVGRRTGQRMNRSFRQAVSRLNPRMLPGASEWDEAVVSRRWILGGVSRHTRQCLLQIIPDRRALTLVPLVLRGSDPDGLVFTDEWPGYLDIPNRWSVCHAREFVRREACFVHTNSIEGVWGHMKELSRHVYRGFPRRTLPEFLSEYMFRYNHRSYRTRLAVLSALLKRPKTNSLVV